MLKILICYMLAHKIINLLIIKWILINNNDVKRNNMHNINYKQIDLNKNN